jgi:hypothetical protein
VSPYEFFLPFDLDDGRLDQALRRIVRDIDDGSPALKRFMVIVLPLLRQLEAESAG